MDRTLDLAVGGITVAYCQIGGTMDCLNAAVLVLFNRFVLDDICAHQTNLSAGFQTEELGRRNLRKVGRFDIQLLGKGNVTGTGFWIGRIIGNREVFHLIHGIVVNDDLHGLGHTDATGSGGIQLLTDAVLQKLNLNKAVGLSNTGTLDEIKDSGRSIAASAQTTKSRHTGIVPSVHQCILNQCTEITLTHYGVGNVEASKLSLLGRIYGKSAVLHNPIVEGTVILKLQRAERIGDAFQRVLNRMRKVIHRINAPLVALTVMMRTNDTVDGRVTHIDVGRCHIDLSTQGLRAIGELAVLHTLEQVKVFFNGAISPRRFLTGLSQSATIFGHLFLSQVADERLAVFDQLNRQLIGLFKVIGTVVNAAGGNCTQPVQILIDRVNVLGVFLGGVSIVIAKIEQTAVLLCGAVIDIDCLGRADVQVAVRLGRETGVNGIVHACSEIFINNLVYKIACNFFHFMILLTCHYH